MAATHGLASRRFAQWRLSCFTSNRFRGRGATRDAMERWVQYGMVRTRDVVAEQTRTGNRCLGCAS